MGSKRRRSKSDYAFALGAGLVALDAWKRRQPKSTDYSVGDKVAVWNIAYQGVGTIVTVSNDLSTGPGTPLVPMFRVQFDDGVLGWVGLAALTKLSDGTATA